MRFATLTVAAVLAAAAFTSPAIAQRSIAHPGNYSDVSAIKILPGQFENYMDYLKREWVKQQEWAKQKGYITGYRILSNVYPRDNEPTIYLVTDYTAVPTTAEIERRNDEFVAMMKSDEHAMETAAEKRGPMRVIGSQTMLQEIILK
jgi:hypothetical protein